MLSLVIVIIVAGGAVLIMDAVAEPTVSFQNNKLNLMMGKSGQLKVKGDPAKKKLPELKYSSSDNNVATITEKGLVKGSGRRKAAGAKKDAAEDDLSDV